MTSTVIARQKFCGKVNKVTASLQDDGTIMIDIISDCPHVQDYARKLTSIEMSDAVSWAGSKIVNPEIRESLSAPCLTPNAVFSAAWLELGMLSRSRAKDIESNVLDFTELE